MEETVTKEQILVKLLCLTQLVNETIDEIKNTNYYKQSFKNQTNKYEKSIESLLSNDISSIYNCNQEAVESIIFGIEKKVEEIIKLTTYQLAELNTKSWENQ